MCKKRYRSFQIGSEDKVSGSYSLFGRMLTVTTPEGRQNSAPLGGTNPEILCASVADRIGSSRLRATPTPPTDLKISPTTPRPSLADIETVSRWHARRQRCTITVAPIFVRLYRSMMSSLDRRMHPDETLPPSFQGSLVPWIRYSVSPR